MDLNFEYDGVDFRQLPTLNEEEFPVDKKLQRFISTLLRICLFVGGGSTGNGHIPNKTESMLIGVVSHLLSQILNYLKNWVRS